MTISKEKVILAREYILEREPKKKFSTFLCVSINDQKIWLIDSENNIVKSYPVSSSKYGVGNINDSFQTPCGLHIIEKKIGDDLPINTMLKGRKVLENGLTTDDLNDPKYEDFKKQHFENFTITQAVVNAGGLSNQVSIVIVEPVFPPLISLSSSLDNVVTKIQNLSSPSLPTFINSCGLIIAPPRPK